MEPRAQCLDQTPLASTEGLVRASSGRGCGLGALCNDGKKSVGREKGRVACFGDTVHSADSLG